jgi:hypothetical protein
VVSGGIAIGIVLGLLTWAGTHAVEANSYLKIDDAKRDFVLKESYEIQIEYQNQALRDLKAQITAMDEKIDELLASQDQAR